MSRVVPGDSGRMPARRAWAYSRVKEAVMFAYSAESVFIGVSGRRCGR